MKKWVGCPTATSFDKIPKYSVSPTTNSLNQWLTHCRGGPQAGESGPVERKAVLSRETNRFICVTSLQVKNYTVRVRIVHVAIPGCPGWRLYLHLTSLLSESGSSTWPFLADVFTFIWRLFYLQFHRGLRTGTHGRLVPRKILMIKVKMIE